MDMTSVHCLTNSISRFIHLVSCLKTTPMPIHKDYRNMVGALKILKPILDDIVDSKIPCDEVVYRNCEELDIVVNEAWEFMEKWSSKISKIQSVWRSEALYVKIRNSALAICHVLHRLLQSSSSISSLVRIQHCMQELQCLKHEGIAEYMEEAARSHSDDTVLCNDSLTRIIELLHLTSNQELLKESIAVEKERMNAQVNKAKGEYDHINQIASLTSQLRDFMLKTKKFDATTGVPVPSYFLCPLSLEIMLDPVIVASGQTYDRISMQKWLENGLTICPKTRQTLNHTNLIPNYTVKAMIENWLEGNNMKISSGSEHTNMVFSPLPLPFNHVHSQDFVHTDSFCSLNSSNSTLRSSFEDGNGFEKQKTDVSCRLGGEESYGCRLMKTDNYDKTSHELSCVHSCHESVSSAISSIEYVFCVSNEASRICDKIENMNLASGEIISEFPVASFSKNEPICSHSMQGKNFDSSNAKAEVAGNGNHNYGATHPFPFSDLGSDDLTTPSHVMKLIEDLKSQSNEVQTKVAAELRLLAKHNLGNRIIIGRCGAILPLLSLLYSQVKLTQEHAVTALLNLSINEENKAMIAEMGAIEPLIHVLKSGNNGAKENSAAALFSLSALEEFKVKIGRSSAVKALVDLLGSGTLRGKKDAATALFNLSIFHENKARIVQAGAVKYLVELMDPESGMVDKSVALLANLSTISEGRLAIVREGGIALLVEIVESGSQRGKENAASVLLQLCLNNPKYCTLVLQEGAVPPLVALSQSGTPRAREKAQQLLSHFRNQRDGSMGTKK